MTVKAKQCQVPPSSKVSYFPSKKIYLLSKRTSFKSNKWDSKGGVKYIPYRQVYLEYLGLSWLKVRDINAVFSKKDSGDKWLNLRKK